MIKHSFFKKIGAIVAFLAIALGGVAIFNNQTEKALSATIPLPVASFSTSLASGITSSATSMTLVSITSDDGTTLQNGSVYGFVIDEGSASEEYVIGTLNTADNTVTSMTRGVSTITGNTAVTTLQKTHRRGASVKITDHPVLTVLARVVNGTETLPNALTYASGVGPINSSDITDKEYVLSVVSGGSVSFEKVVVAATAGETITAGNVVYLKASDGFWWKADADDLATLDGVQLGIAQGSGTATNAISGGVLLRGLDTNNTGTAGSSVYISNTAGGVSTSSGTNARIIGQYKPSSGGLYFNPEYSQTLTVGQKAAVQGGSTFGTPSSTNKFITQDYNSSATGLPVVRKYDTESSTIGDSTTQFDISNPSGTTFRYTWDSTGTDPSISLSNHPIGSLINFQTQNFNSANNGLFVVTGAGSNYVEVTNVSGVVELNKTIGTGYIIKSGSTPWTKPSGLKYIIVEVTAGGGNGGSGFDNGTSGYGGGGGGGGGYSRELIQSSSLSSTEYFIVGGAKKYSYFGSYLYATSGSDGEGGATGNAGGTPGVGVNGDINVEGEYGSPGISTNVSSSIYGQGGNGGSSYFGGGGRGAKSDAVSGSTTSTYGGGGGGGAGNGSSTSSGGNGYKGVIIITEYYS